MSAKKKPYPILFRDAEGREITLPSNLKLEQLFVMGLTANMVHPMEPQQPGHFRHTELLSTNPSPEK